MRVTLALCGWVGASVFLWGAAAARADLVTLRSACRAPREQALRVQLGLLGVELREERGPVAGERDARAWLARRTGGALLILGPDCAARVYGVHGERYEVPPGTSRADWALRVAELAYALAAYGPPAAPDPPAARAESPADAGAPVSSAQPAPAHEVDRGWSAELGAALWYVPALGGPMPALGVEVARAVGGGVWLLASGLASLRGARLGDVEASAASGALRLAVGPRARWPVRRRAGLEASLTYGAWGVWSRGRAQAPLRPRSDRAWTSMATVSLGVTYRPGPRWGALCRVAAARALPGVRLVLAEQQRLLGVALDLQLALRLRL